MPVTPSIGKTILRSCAPDVMRHTPHFSGLQTTRKPRRCERGCLLWICVGHETVLHSEQAGAGALRDTDLRIDVLDVIAGGLARDHQALRDLLVGKSARHELEYL